MRPVRRPLRLRPAPERVLAWAERERVLALWMYGASARGSVLHSLRMVSRMSDGWAWLAIGLALPWLDPHRGTACVVRMVAVGAVNLLLYLIVKRFVARPRPYHGCAGIRPCAPALDEFSFPSGHTMHAVAFSLILCTYHPRLGFVLWPFTLLVAASRVVLGLHYPSDVLVGAAVGALTAGVSFQFL